jgi:hypothetical protein
MTAQAAAIRFILADKQKQERCISIWEIIPFDSNTNKNGKARYAWQLLWKGLTHLATILHTAARRSRDGHKTFSCIPINFHNVKNGSSPQSVRPPNAATVCTMACLQNIDEFAFEIRLKYAL